MPQGQNPRFTEGPLTFPVDASVVAGIDGGVLVEPMPGNTGSPPTVRPASAASLTVLGVTENPGAPAGTDPALDLAARDPRVTVHVGCIILVTFAAAAVAGQRLQTAANGQVTPWVAAGDPRLIVGTCYDGAVALGAKGLAFIAPIGVSL